MGDKDTSMGIQHKLLPLWAVLIRFTTLILSLYKNEEIIFQNLYNNVRHIIKKPNTSLPTHGKRVPLIQNKGSHE